MRKRRIINEWPSDRLKLEGFEKTERTVNEWDAATGQEQSGTTRFAIIYGLCEPEDRPRQDGTIVAAGTFRYVGQTWEPHRRFRRHLAGARNGGTTRSSRWIRALKAQGNRPLHVILEQGYYRTQAELDDAEQRWIAALRCAPDTDWLINHTAGGHARGLFIGEAGEESKAKMSAAARSEARLAQLERMRNDPEVQARRKANVAKAQQSPEWREKMREILAKTHANPETVAKRIEQLKSPENLERLRRAANERANWKLSSTLHITGSRQFSGQQRAMVWSLIRDGMTLGEWFEECKNVGACPRRARNELYKFVHDFHIAEVR